MLNDLVENWFAESLDCPFDKMHEENGVPTVDLKVQFRQAGLLADVITKSLWIIKLGKTSLTYGFRFSKGETTLIEGEATLVHVKMIDGGIKATAWGDALTKKLESFLF